MHYESAFSAVFYESYVTDQPTSLIDENDQLYFVALVEEKLSTYVDVVAEYPPRCKIVVWLRLLTPRKLVCKK